ncbi:hypothetical protein KIN20_008852 [Parelaphostrongylus tenuis]|uniref:Uncharacterized protein n=1 Tax=Parelaphostrongylus tenuis TaxID=148309 RepID=A0AAD5QK51_PARTN|nr:hypothetical protein KIN20_008852 [Parelaphostrongylus tenuis]
MRGEAGRGKSCDGREITAAERCPPHGLLSKKWQQRILHLCVPPFMLDAQECVVRAQKHINNDFDVTITILARESETSTIKTLEAFCINAIKPINES